MRLVKLMLKSLLWAIENLYFLLIIACFIVVLLKHFNIYPVDEYHIFLAFFTFPFLIILWQVKNVEKKLDRLTKG